VRDARRAADLEHRQAGTDCNNIIRRNNHLYEPLAVLEGAPRDTGPIEKDAAQHQHNEDVEFKLRQSRCAFLTVYAEDRGWYQVDWRGVVGWVSSRYVAYDDSHCDYQAPVYHAPRYQPQYQAPSYGGGY
jgi:hypothetical protein